MNGKFEAEIEFTERVHWEKEIGKLLDDIRDEGDAETSERVSSNVALAKVRSIGLVDRACLHVYSFPATSCLPWCHAHSVVHDGHECDHTTIIR